MRADKLLMLGVVGIGAYAVYRMVAAPRGPSPSFDRPLPRPVLPEPFLPEQPGAVLLPPESVGTVLLGENLPLQRGRWYGGRLETNDASGPLSDPAGSRQSLAAALARYGFGGSAVRPDAPEAAGLPTTVQIYMGPNEAQGRVPDYALANPGRGTRWFYGRWTRPSQTIVRSAGMSLIWMAAPPDVRAYTYV